MERRIRAVYLDWDHTLYSHKQKTIPQSALDAIGNLREKGILVFLASGRHIRELDDMWDKELPFDGFVTLSGQLNYDKDWNLLSSYPIKGNMRQEAIQLFEQRKIPTVFLNEKGYYLNTVTSLVEKVQKDISSPVHPLGAFQGEEIYMVTVFAKEKDLEETKRKLSEGRMSHWHDYGWDFIAREGGKEIGMIALEKRYGFTAEESMAFGDSDNDLEMLQHASLGIAMKDSDPKLLAVADDITDTPENDGIYKALVKYGLL